MKSTPENISTNLQNIGRAIDFIGDTNLRRYIDAQLVIIHCKINNKPIKRAQQDAVYYWNKLHE